MPRRGGRLCWAEAHVGPHCLCLRPAPSLSPLPNTSVLPVNPSGRRGQQRRHAPLELCPAPAPSSWPQAGRPELPRGLLALSRFLRSGPAALPAPPVPGVRPEGFRPQLQRHLLLPPVGQRLLLSPPSPPKRLPGHQALRDVNTDSPAGKPRAGSPPAGSRAAGRRTGTEDSDTQLPSRSLP